MSENKDSITCDTCGGEVYCTVTIDGKSHCEDCCFEKGYESEGHALNATNNSIMYNNGSKG